MINLKDLEHFRNNPMVQFKEETVGGVEVVIPHYMIANDELWKQPLATELRGHVFRKDTGECISMAFHKFWNINERQETLVENIDWTKPLTVYEKCDGSMVSAVLIEDEVYFKTKKTFYSDVAKLANEYANNEVKYLTRYLLSNGLSPIYEFTHPDWKIVVDYGKEPTWTLLAIRVIETGEYIPLSAPESMIIRIPKSFDLKSYDEIKNSIDTLEGMEGYVIEFEDGSRYKTKCNWYLLRHRINTDLRERDVIRMIHDETIDDVKSVIVEAGHDLDKVLELEERYMNEYNTIVHHVTGLCSQLQNEPDKKSMAQKYGRNKYFGLAVKLFEGRNVDYKYAWEKEYLKEYSLKTLYSDFNHAGKVDDNEYHIDDDGNLILDELGRPIPSTVCLCHAHEPSECMCGAWDDIAYDWYDNNMGDYL